MFSHKTFITQHMYMHMSKGFMGCSKYLWTCYIYSDWNVEASCLQRCTSPQHLGQLQEMARVEFIQMFYLWNAPKDGRDPLNVEVRTCSPPPVTTPIDLQNVAQYDWHSEWLPLHRIFTAPKVDNFLLYCRIAPTITKQKSLYINVLRLVRWNPLSHKTILLNKESISNYL